MTRLELWNGDICVLEVDAIVNPASPTLWMSTGVGGALKRAGGDAIEYAAVRQGPVPVGSAIVTGAGDLAARAIIHAVSLDPNHRTCLHFKDFVKPDVATSTPAVTSTSVGIWLIQPHRASQQTRKAGSALRCRPSRAGDGIRTHDVQLGKLAFYP